MAEGRAAVVGVANGAACVRPRCYTDSRDGDEVLDSTLTGWAGKRGDSGGGKEGGTIKRGLMSLMVG